MNANTRKLHALGQSLWLDNISRPMLDDGTLAVWAGVNLCEVKSVTLNRNASGATWADYD